MQKNQTLCDVLLELQTLDRVPRSGYFLRGIVDPESVSEHSFHLVFMVWALAAQTPELDRLRAIELAMVHDLPEVRTGDLPRTAAHYLPAGAKQTAEQAVAADLLAPLGAQTVELLREYQERTTPEARFVAICDKLQLLIKATVYEDWGAAGLNEFFDRVDGFSDGGFVAIRHLLDELLAYRAEKQA